MVSLASESSVKKLGEIAKLFEFSKHVFTFGKLDKFCFEKVEDIQILLCELGILELFGSGTINQQL